ncbi:MAG: hypothetical protein RL088_4044 [Verrucomicrobiota bacterium]|jgi:hypothetical protein
MKSLLATILFLASSVLSIAQISPVRMDVVQRQKTDSSGKSNESKKQIRSLEITLQNFSRENHDGLEVKYWFFSRGVKSGDTSVLKQGERKVSLAAGQKQIVESEQVASSFTEDHYKVENKKGGKGSNGSTRQSISKVEGSGERIVGYGVRVSSGGKVLAETFSPQGLKEKVR